MQFKAFNVADVFALVKKIEKSEKKKVTSCFSFLNII